MQNRDGEIKYSRIEAEVGDLVEFSNIADVPVFNEKGRVIYYRTEISPYSRFMIINEHFAGEPYKSMRKRIIERRGK